MIGKVQASLCLGAVEAALLVSVSGVVWTLASVDEPALRATSLSGFTSRARKSLSRLLITQSVSWNRFDNLVSMAQLWTRVAPAVKETILSSAI